MLHTPLFFLLEHPPFNTAFSLFPLIRLYLWNSQWLSLIHLFVLLDPIYVSFLVFSCSMTFKIVKCFSDVGLDFTSFTCPYLRFYFLHAYQLSVVMLENLWSTSLWSILGLFQQTTCNQDTIHALFMILHCVYMSLNTLWIIRTLFIRVVKGKWRT